MSLKSILYWRFARRPEGLSKQHNPHAMPSDSGVRVSAQISGLGLKVLITEGIKDIIVALGLPVCRFYFSRFPIFVGKRTVWHKIIQPRPRWQLTKTRACTEFGAMLNLDLADIIQSRIYFFGVFEPVITRYVSENLRPGDIFIDVGANIGYYSLLAAKLVGPAGKVFAIEASPTIFAKLESHLSENKTNNISAMNVAITERHGEVVVYLHDGTNLGGTTIMPQVASERATMIEGSTPGVPLPCAIDPDLIRAARLIKIDVEGAEWGVLLGMRDLLPTLSDRTELIVEITPRALSAQGIEVQQLFDLLGSAGFQPFYIENDYEVHFYLRKTRPKLIPFSAFTNNDDEFAGRELIDLVFRRTSPDATRKP